MRDNERFIPRGLRWFVYFLRALSVRSIYRKRVSVVTVTGARPATTHETTETPNGQPLEQPRPIV